MLAGQRPFAPAIGGSGRSSQLGETPTMQTKLLSLLAGVALAVSFSAAQAGEPQRLTATQLDGVTAGAAIGASLGAAACQGGSTACGTSAWQSARANSSLRVGSNG